MREGRIAFKMLREKIYSKATLGNFKGGWDDHIYYVQYILKTTISMKNWIQLVQDTLYKS